MDISKDLTFTRQFEHRKDTLMKTNITLKCTPLIAAAVLAAAISAIAQAGGGPVAEKLAAVKQSVAENQQKLHHYQWKETTQLTLKGDPKPPSAVGLPVWSGREGTENTAHCATTASEWRKNEAEGDREQEGRDEGLHGTGKGPARQVRATRSAKHATGLRIRESLVEFPIASSGVTQIVFKDYALAGDQMTISFDTAAKKITTVNVNTYLDDPKDVVTLAVQFASLPDGTNYVQQTVLDATAKKSRGDDNEFRLQGAGRAVTSARCCSKIRMKEISPCQEFHAT